MLFVQKFPVHREPGFPQRQADNWQTWRIRDWIGLVEQNSENFQTYDNCLMNKEKSRIRETKHLSTDADSSTDTTVGLTKNIQKPDFFEKRKKKSSKITKTQRCLEICQN